MTFHSVSYSSEQEPRDFIVFPEITRAHVATISQPVIANLVLFQFSPMHRQKSSAPPIGLHLLTRFANSRSGSVPTPDHAGDPAQQMVLSVIPGELQPTFAPMI
jgi:hypothetical protein